MKRFLLTGVMLVLLSLNSNASSFFIKQPEGTKQKIVYVVGSLALIGAGVHVMQKDVDDMVSFATGFGVAYAGTSVLYFTIFEW